MVFDFDFRDVREWIIEEIVSFGFSLTGGWKIRKEIFVSTSSKKPCHFVFGYILIVEIVVNRM